MISGLMISKIVMPFFGVEASMGGAWKMIHKVAADAAMMLVAAHVGLHWKWIWNMFKNLVVNPLSRIGKKEPELIPVKVEARVE